MLDEYIISLPSIKSSRHMITSTAPFGKVYGLFRPLTWSRGIQWLSPRSGNPAGRRRSASIRPGSEPQPRRHPCRSRPAGSAGHILRKRMTPLLGTIGCMPGTYQPKTGYLNDKNSLLAGLNIRETEFHVKQNRPQAPSFHAEKYIGSDRDSTEGQRFIHIFDKG
jgi:hypothetical protein